MCKLTIAGIAAVYLGMVPAAFAMDEARAVVKFGVGGLYNKMAVNGKSRGGGHVSIDVNLPTGRTAVSPLVEVYRKSGVTSVWAGANLLIKPPMGDRGCVYFGAGGGVLHTKEAGKRLNKGSFDVLGGLEIRTTRRFSFFLEPRYVWAASRTVNGVAGHAGLAFYVM